MDALKAQARARQRKRIRERRREMPSDWRGWLTRLFPEHFTAPFARHHEEFWEWVWSIGSSGRPRPLVLCLPRKGGKSTNVETSCVAVGAPRLGNDPVRTYVLYVCGTQTQADDHVKTIGSHLESSAVGRVYPKLAEARVDEYGDRWGWNRQRLVTESGLIVDGYGLMGQGSRGAKLEEYRPDYIVLDDIDDESDSIEVVKKKENRIQQQVIPAGDRSNRAILFVQNKVHRQSVMTRLLEGRAEWLYRRRVIGPVPAVEGLQYEQVYDEELDRLVYEITGGTPSWVGFDLEDAEDEINDVGPTSFLVEYQHETGHLGGGVFDHVDYPRLSLSDAMDVGLERIVVSVDPAISEGDGSDCHAVQVDALGTDNRIYRLWSWEQVASPEKALRVALRKAVQYGAGRVVIETDQGGEAWTSVYLRAWDQLVEDDAYPDINEHTQRPPYRSEKAGTSNKSKRERAHEMLYDYETDRIRHVRGAHQTLERALDRYDPPDGEPLDLGDAAYWSWHHLRKRSGGKAYDLS